MVMRLTDKQREYARSVGRLAVAAGIRLGCVFTLQEHHKLHGPVDWGEHFKHKDITPENQTVLDDLFDEAYQVAYDEWAFKAMTPMTLKEYENDQAEEQAVEQFISSFAVSMKR